MNDKRTPADGIVGIVANGVKGRHSDEIEKASFEKGRKAALEGREIVSEVELGPSSGPSAGKNVVVTPEIKQLASDGKMSIEDAAEVIEFKQGHV